MIKVLASPINPSDIFFMRGKYHLFDIFPLKYPTVSGWEGSGIVVASGGGFMAWKAMGKRVAFAVAGDHPEFSKTGGAHQQYTVVPAMNLNYLPDSIPSDIGSMHFVNPLTAIGLVERC